MNTPALSPMKVAMDHLDFMHRLSGVPRAQLLKLRNVVKFLRDFGVRNKLPVIRFPKKGNPKITIVWRPLANGFYQEEIPIKPTP